jgi:hypothetical protein
MNDLRNLLRRIPPELRLPFSVLILTFAADYLVYGSRPGLGLALYLPAAWIGLLVNRSRAKPSWRERTLFVLMGASAIQMAVAPSFSNSLVLILLTLYASGHYLLYHCARGAIP